MRTKKKRLTTPPDALERSQQFREALTSAYINRNLPLDNRPLSEDPQRLLAAFETTCKAFADVQIPEGTSYNVAGNARQEASKFCRQHTEIKLADYDEALASIQKIAEGMEQKRLQS